MSVGFRKSLLGFNCSDVIEYIENTHKTFVKKEKDLNSKVENLCSELELSKSAQDKLLTENRELSSKLEEFNAKYEEIERLSENIGKLYLVAQANARAIMESSEANSQLASAEVSRNLSSIDEAHESLKELRAEITKTSDDFINEVDRLISSLNTTREQIAVNTETAENAKSDFEEVYKSIAE